MAVLVIPEERRTLRANWYLAALIFVLALRLAIRFLFRSGYFQTHNPLITIALSCDLLLGPCLYFYTLLLTRLQQPRGWRFLLHWIPGGVGILASLWLFVRVQYDPTSFSRSQSPMQLGFIGWHMPSVVSIVAYSVASLRQLQHHRKRIREQFSNLEQINLTWLRWLCGFLVVASLSLFIQSPGGKLNAVWQSAVYVLFIYFIGYMGIRQPAIFQHSSTEKSECDVDPPPQPKRPAEANLPIDSGEIWSSLQRLMETEQPFRRPNINLDRLAELMEIPFYRLSAVINHHGNCSFYDYINRLRVENAKQLLLDESCKLNILDIGMESGFNSKSTFYSQFKKSTGKTPTEFRASRNSGTE